MGEICGSSRKTRGAATNESAKIIVKKWVSNAREGLKERRRNIKPNTAVCWNRPRAVRYSVGL